ncbi:MAG: transcriptional regulator [Chloroflexi bacterium]|nr:transcriptional regulator [Chloroflexota bacterium]
MTNDIKRRWAAISPLFSLHNEQRYQLAIKRLDELIDEIGTDEEHPLYELLDTLGTIVHAREEQHHKMPDSGGKDTLRFLIDEHGLTQSDVPEVGSQGVVSEILRGKREMNVRQVRALAKRFHVSPAVFV